MSTHLPLNPVLHRRLVHLFGDVHISNAGLAYSFYPAVVNGKRRQNVRAAGEQYCVRCPYCQHLPGKDPDCGHHLNIGYLWGIPGSHDDQRWWMANCFRNPCMEQHRFRKDLQDRVYGDYDLGRRKAFRILPGIPAVALPAIAEWPGECIPIKDLPPNHMAVEYLASRRMDPYAIAAQYDLRFCLEPPTSELFPVKNRIVIPIYMNGTMATWQARYTGNVDWKRTGISKYYNEPGSRRSQCLYDFDMAKTMPFITIVESAPTCWWLGTGTTAILGKSLSGPQIQLLKNNWRAAVIALDANAYYQVEDGYARLATHMPVVKLLFEKGQDPGEMPQEQFWDLVWKAAETQRVTLV